MCRMGTQAQGIRSWFRFVPRLHCDSGILRRQIEHWQNWTKVTVFSRSGKKSKPKIFNSTSPIAPPPPDVPYRRDGSLANFHIFYVRKKQGAQRGSRAASPTRHSLVFSLLEKTFERKKIAAAPCQRSVKLRNTCHRLVWGFRHPAGGLSQPYFW